MLKNHLLITIRSMMKNKVFIVINVLGMSLAIACCIVAYFAYEYDAAFDSVHVNRENIYRISTISEFENSSTYVAYTPLALGKIVHETFPDVERSTRYLRSGANFKRENDLFESNLSYVDADFFDMFSFDFIAGNPAALKDRSSVFISEAIAVRLFSTPQQALGKSLQLVYGHELKDVTIAGIFHEPPANSSFYRKDGSAYMNAENYTDEYGELTDDSWMARTYLYVQISPDRVTGVYQQLQPYTKINNRIREDLYIKEFVLDPFTTMAHHDRAENIQPWTWAAPPSAAVMGSAVMATLILLLACFNLTNTTIAISSRRLKEIGIRKVMGSMRKQLIIQFIGETIFICFCALIIGLLLTDILVQGWNVMTSYNIRLTPHYLDAPEFLLFLAGVLLFTGILAGSYPAFYISRFEPVSILKGKVRFGGTNYFTRILLGLQFSISLITIVSAIGFLQNAQYQREYDLGFDMRGSIIAWVNDKSEYDTYRNALASNPDILSIAGANSGIFSNRGHAPLRHESKQLEADIIYVGDNYLKTMDLKLIEGRDFMKDSETDQKESVIITEKMKKLFGWNNAIGKEIIWQDTVKCYVVGVVKDVYTRGLWYELDPMMIRYVLPDQYNQIVISTDDKKVPAVNAYMKEKWAGLFPNTLYNGSMLVSNLHELEDLNMSIVYMYTFLGILATLLSATGLFTLVSMNIIKRMKEIGVRKVMGASVLNIARIINTEFVIILAVAAALGSWASYSMSTIVMGSVWKYYQGVNVLTFVIAISLIFTVSLLTIGYKIFSVATMNPVRTLQDE